MAEAEIHEGNLTIHTRADAEKYRNVTKVTGDLYIYAEAKLTANKLYSGGYDKFTVIDGIACCILSSKKQDDIAILLCRGAKIRNRKVVGDKFFVAQSKGHNAHGKTIAEAVQELAFKTGPRDFLQWENLPRNTSKTPQEWAFVYRMITGACRYGTDQFLASKGKLKKKYTVSEIIAETKGAYGHDKFREVVGAE